MLGAAIDVLIEAISSAIGWVVRVLRGGAVEAVLAGSEPSTEALRNGGRRERRQMRKHFSALADAGDFDELIALYRRLSWGTEFRDLRIDAIMVLTRTAPDRGEPLLREILLSADDPFVVLMVLDRVAHHRMVGLLDAVQQAAGEDSPPLVAKQAQDVHRRLLKTLTN